MSASNWQRFLHRGTSQKSRHSEGVAGKGGSKSSKWPKKASGWNVEGERLLSEVVAVVVERTHGMEVVHLRPRGARRSRRAAGVTIIHLQPPKTQGSPSARVNDTQPNFESR